MGAQLLFIGWCTVARGAGVTSEGSPMLVVLNSMGRLFAATPDGACACCCGDGSGASVEHTVHVLELQLLESPAPGSAPGKHTVALTLIGGSDRLLIGSSYAAVTALVAAARARSPPHPLRRTNGGQAC